MIGRTIMCNRISVTLNMEVKEPAHAYQKKFYSIQEYLQMEGEALEKHEYYKGEIFAMSGAGIRHNINRHNIMPNACT